MKEISVAKRLSYRILHRPWLSLYRRKTGITGGKSSRVAVAVAVAVAVVVIVIVIAAAAVTEWWWWQQQQQQYKSLCVCN